LFLTNIDKFPQSAVVPFIASGAGGAAAPEGANPDLSLYYVDEDTPLVDIHGRVPKPGLYVLVAQYFQPNSPGKFTIIISREKITKPLWTQKYDTLYLLFFTT
jgi:hypothetical protein